jgi:CRP-like cAMP-binding protein
MPAASLEAPIVTDTNNSRFLPFLDAGEEDALLAAAPVRSFAPEELVFDQDVALRAIFLIDSGSVRVERRDRGALVPLATLGPGEFFGEMSFVAGTPTSARVVADEPTRLKMIDQAVIDQMTKADPAFGARLYRSIAAILAERLRLTNLRTWGDQSWN